MIDCYKNDPQARKEVPHSFFQEVARYANGIVVIGGNVSAAPDKELFHIDAPEDNGFYLETGIGYDTNDELFAGVPIAHKQQPTDGDGSGVPAKRFLEFLRKWLHIHP